MTPATKSFCFGFLPQAHITMSRFSVHRCMHPVHSIPKTVELLQWNHDCVHNKTRWPNAAISRAIRHHHAPPILPPILPPGAPLQLFRIVSPPPAGSLGQSMAKEPLPFKTTPCPSPATRQTNNASPLRAAVSAPNVVLHSEAAVASNSECPPPPGLTRLRRVCVRI